MKCLFFSAAAVAIVVVASLALALDRPPHLLHAQDGDDIEMIRCTTQTCEPSSCTVIGKWAEGACATPPKALHEKRKESARFHCRKRPNRQCIWQSSFNSSLPGGKDCSPRTMLYKNAQICGECTGGGDYWSKTTCSETVITMHTSCKAGCADCKYTQHYKVGCTGEDFMSTSYSAPFACTHAVEALGYENTTTCSTKPQKASLIANLCYGSVSVKDPSKQEGGMYRCVAP